MSWNVILKYCFFSVFTFQIDHIYTVYFVMSTFLNPFEYQIKSLRCFYYEEMIIFLFLPLSALPLHLHWQMRPMCHRVLRFQHAQMPRYEEQLMILKSDEAGRCWLILTVEEGGNSVITAGVVCLLLRFIDPTINNVIHNVLLFLHTITSYQLSCINK